MKKPILLLIFLSIVLNKKKHHSHKYFQLITHRLKTKQVQNGGSCTVLVNDFYEICK